MNMLENVCVFVCVPGSDDRLTERSSELKDRHDCRQQQPTSGCQVALEIDESKRQKAEKQEGEGGPIFYLPSQSQTSHTRPRKLLAN